LSRSCSNILHKEADSGISDKSAFYSHSYTGFRLENINTT